MSSDGVSTSACIFSAPSGEGHEYACAMGIGAAGGLLVEVSEVYGRQKLAEKSYETTATLPWSSWTHVAFCFEPSTARLTLYVNGEEQAVFRRSDDALSELRASSRPYTLGGPAAQSAVAPGALPNHFTGRIARVAMWSLVPVGDRDVEEARSSNRSLCTTLHGLIRLTMEGGLAAARRVEEALATSGTPARLRAYWPLDEASAADDVTGRRAELAGAHGAVGSDTVAVVANRTMDLPNLSASQARGRLATGTAARFGYGAPPAPACAGLVLGTGEHFRFDVDDDLTLSLWLRFETYQGVQAIVDQLGRGAGWQLAYSEQRSALTFTLRDRNGAERSIHAEIRPDFAWHHYVVAVDRDEGAVLYCDGVVLSRANVAGLGSLFEEDRFFGRAVNCPLIVGGSCASSDTGRFEGLMSDLRLFRGTAWTAEQARDAFLHPEVGVLRDAHAILWLPFSPVSDISVAALVPEFGATVSERSSAANRKPAWWVGGQARIRQRAVRADALEGASSVPLPASDEQLGFHLRDGDILCVPAYGALDLAGSDFTVDGWFRDAKREKRGSMVRLRSADRITFELGWAPLYFGSQRVVARVLGGGTCVADTALGDDWNHLAVVVRASGGARLFLNGAPAGAAAELRLPPGDAALEIEGAGDFHVDDIRVHRRALDAGELSSGVRARLQRATGRTGRIVETRNI